MREDTIPIWSAASATDPITIEELRAFADESGEVSADGTPLDYYTPRWIRFLERQESPAFHWAACLFGFNWCMWRKQYALAAGVLAAELLIGAAVGFGYTAGRGPLEEHDFAIVWLSYAALPIVRVPLGLRASQLYLARARVVIATARQLATRRQQLDCIREKGGTSVAALGIGIALGLLGALL